MVDGVEVSPARVIGETTKRGTKVHYLADDEIFGTVEYHYDILAKRLRELSFLNNGVKIRLIDQRTGKEEDFAFAGGVKGFVEYINRAKTVLHPNVFYAQARPASPPATATTPSSRSKSPCSGTTATRNRCCASPTTSRRPTAAPT